MIEAPTQYDIAVLAGSSDRPDPLNIETGAPIKALIPLAGRPMVEYVLRALAASGRARRAAVVGLDAETLDAMTVDLPLIAVPDHGGIIDNGLAAIEALGNPSGHLLFCTCDIPLLTPEAVRYLVDAAEASGADLCYPIVSREVMEARFPGSGRSFRRTADGYYAGGDLSMMRADTVRANVPFINTLTANRKNVWGLVKALGPGIIVRYATRRMRIVDVERRAGHILNCTCAAIPLPHAEIAMDVDKPHHLHLVQQAMAVS